MRMLDSINCSIPLDHEDKGRDGGPSERLRLSTGNNNHASQGVYRNFSFWREARSRLTSIGPRDVAGVSRL
jgi:hypothetical protein